MFLFGLECIPLLYVCSNCLICLRLTSKCHTFGERLAGPCAPYLCLTDAFTVDTERTVVAAISMVLHSVKCNHLHHKGSFRAVRTAHQHRRQDNLCISTLADAYIFQNFFWPTVGAFSHDGAFQVLAGDQFHCLVRM
ncbi:hypothetical protein CY34DRAFT_389177 [Suillus luteus UH-Slu-Lm8-n1]|uniref:Secreted protein n=1 Tax=Suillus luteus UH-Slu-Lm8-n1 TaxID=930992 RepID=A0A0C9ZLW7_9AGAM|nr:hypothetical protein CY34DRAFT_389177 [Suillus luteus UH-Slu-Lm8-n1]